MRHEMPKLPYEQNALAPRLSAETLAYHYGKHVQTYVDNLNKLLPGTDFENKSLEDIVRHADGPIYNNAAQVWNHAFYFDSLASRPVDIPASLKMAIERSFGSVDAFKDKLLGTASALFGAGWVWLVVDEKCRLSVVPAPNAGNPLRDGLRPILVIDVWEHAYYIDYRNRRVDYLLALWEILDWTKVEQRLNRVACNVYI